MTTLHVPLLPAQYDFMTARERFVAYVTGVGGGKTFSGARKTVAITSQNPKTPWLAAANSYRQLEDVVIPEIGDALDEFGIDFEFLSGKQRFELPNGSRIFCRSLFDRKSINKLRGTAFRGAWLDEARDMPQYAFEVVQARIGRKRGPLAQAFITTTPSGLNWIHRVFVRDVRSGKRSPENYRLIRGKTIDNVSLPPEYIDSLLESYDERTRREELDGEFVPSGNRLYHAFDGDKSVDERARYHAEEPIILALDFNVIPCVAAVIQELRGRTCVVDEIFDMSGKGTEGVIETFIDRYPGCRSPIIFGDPAGHGRSSTTGKSDYEMWRIALPEVQIRVPRSPYPIVDRINSTNVRLKDGKGRRRLLVNPACVRTIEDFDQVQPATNGSREPRKDKDTPLLTHISDAIGYYVVHNFSVRKRVDRLKQARIDAAFEG